MPFLHAPFIYLLNAKTIRLRERKTRTTQLKPTNEKSGNSTVAYQNHVACGYGYKVVCTYDDKYSKEVQVYRGLNPIHFFLQNMFKEERYCAQTRRDHFNKEMIITKQQEI